MSFPPHMSMMTATPYFPSITPMMVPPNVSIFSLWKKKIFFYLFLEMSKPPPIIPTSIYGTQKTGENEKVRCLFHY